MATPSYSKEKQEDMSGLSLVVDEVATDTLILGSSTMSGTELGYVDSITPGTVTASKAVVVDVNKDISSFRNTAQTGTLTVGVDDTGADVKFFGATTAKSWLWDES